MHGAGRGDAVDGAMQGFNAPCRGFVHVDIECRLIELDDIDAVVGEPARLGVEQVGKCHRHFHAVAVMGVGDGVDDGHRAGQGEFEFAVGVGAGDARFTGVHAAAKAELADDSRTHGLVAIVADADLDALFEIDAIDGFEKAVHKVLPRLLAVGDDVDAGVFLQLDGEDRGIVLGCFKLLALKTPGGPQPVRFGEPGGFWQAAGDRGRKQHGGNRIRGHETPPALALDAPSAFEIILNVA